MSVSIAIEAGVSVCAALDRWLLDVPGLDLSAAGSTGVDCLLIAHEPPRVDALARLAELSGDEGFPRIPVVVLCDDDDDLRRSMLRAGAMDVVGLADAGPRALARAVGDALVRFSTLRHAREARRSAPSGQLAEPHDRSAGHPGHLVIGWTMDPLRPELGRSAETALDDWRFVSRILDSLFAFVGLLDVHGTVIDVNWAPLAAGGIGIEDVRGQRFWDCYWWSYSDEVRERLRSACERAARGELVRHDVVVRMAGDSRMTIDFQIAPIRDHAGRITHLIPSAVDITERKRAEEELTQSESALRVSEARFRALADNIAQLVWVTDETGYITWYNRRWFEFTGTTLEDVQGWGWQKIHHPDHLERVVEKYRRHLESGEPWEDTFPLRGRDGHYRWFLSRAFPLRDDTGRILFWFGTNTDVTAQREAEEALREADRRKDEFIAILAHELRNPLAPVRTAVQILRRLGGAGPRVEHARDVIDRQVTHMARLIDDLLDVSRIARGKLALQRQACDLAAIAQQTAEDYRLNLQAKGLRLTVVPPVEPVWVEGDPVRLAQMVGNLLHNAGRFTEDGGTVEVRTERDLVNHLAKVSVTDTGIGIDPALLPRLFDPLSQGDQDFARSKGGLGLGLALTKGLAELHGGGVDAHSEGVGGGSTFTLRIPLSVARYGVSSRLASGSQAGDRLRILVVEDNHDAAETLGALLELAGHQVELAHDGAAALDLARRRCPDVVISDLGLPGALDGFAIARTMREDPSLRGAGLIALSGYANADARRRSREAGFDAHLAKPPDIDRLERALVEHATRNLTRPPRRT